MTTKLRTLILTDTQSKARALKRLLSKHYTVVSTDGFLRDLPKTQLAVDPDNYFAMKVITVRGKAPLLNQLKHDTVDALRIYVATEPDANGEAFAEHYCRLFGINPESKCRIELNEITKDAVKRAIGNARSIDVGQVERYWTRRLTNRLISYNLNPYLWCSVYRGLTINPMQLLLLRLIHDYKVEPLQTEWLNDAPVNLKTLQLWAAHELNFSAGRVVLIARQLYEGMTLGKNFSGLITYFKNEPIKSTVEELTPEELKEFLTGNQLKVYSAIRSGHLTFAKEMSATEKPSDFALMLKLESLKINWTDSYSTAINMMVKSNYVKRVDACYEVTESGLAALSALDKYFSNVIDVNFFIDLETKLNDVAANRLTRIEVLRSIYEPFKEALSDAMKSLGENPKPKEPPVIESDQVCDKCGRRMVIKRGRYGLFLACPGYPECKNTMPYVDYLDVHCPKCGGRLTAKTLNHNRTFYGCENYPECDFGTWDTPQEKTCSICGALMLLRHFKDRQSMLYCSNEKCPSRANHPINKIIEKSRKQSLERQQKKSARSDEQ